MTTMVEDIFRVCSDAASTASYNFITEQKMDDAAASMEHFIRDNGLEKHVRGHEGTLFVLDHPNYDFYVAMESYNLGNPFIHGVIGHRAEKYEIDY